MVGMTRLTTGISLALMIVPTGIRAEDLGPIRRPLTHTVDLDVGESAQVPGKGDRPVQVRLAGVEVDRDPIRSAVRSSRVKLEIDGRAVVLACGNYELPRTVGRVQVDCPIVADYEKNSTEDHWGLDKAARLRFWPAGSPWVERGTFVYPVRQRWFAGLTQMANEPTFVDGGEDPRVSKIYYHSGLDVGGAEGMVEVVAATDGLVVSAGLARLNGHDDSPVRPRYDVVYLLDGRGWYYRYSHMKSIDPAIRPGARVRIGQRIGQLGKEGGSGGWSHQHFEIKARQPSGRWGTEEGYAYIWQAGVLEKGRNVVAVARPHVLARVGDRVTLDGSKSWCREGTLARYAWTFGDGTRAEGPRVERVYDRPGTYSEILEVADASGRVDYDFAAVQVVDAARPDAIPPTIHPAYAPTEGIRPNDPVTFKVRTFRTTDGEETWDFGDGTPPATVRSDGNVDQHAPDGYAAVVHRFARKGDFLVRVERADRRGWKATGRLHVHVD